MCFTNRNKFANAFALLLEGAIQNDDKFKRQLTNDEASGDAEMEVDQEALPEEQKTETMIIDTTAAGQAKASRRLKDEDKFA